MTSGLEANYFGPHWVVGPKNAHYYYYYYYYHHHHIFILFCLQGAFPRPSSESVQDIQAEIRGWVINKGLGETLLHRAARLGYTVRII